jgi:hypothetical protein
LLRVFFDRVCGDPCPIRPFSFRFFVLTLKKKEKQMVVCPNTTISSRDDIRPTGADALMISGSAAVVLVKPAGRSCPVILQLRIQPSQSERRPDQLHSTCANPAWEGQFSLSGPRDGGGGEQDETRARARTPCLVFCIKTRFCRWLRTCIFTGRAMRMAAYLATTRTRYGTHRASSCSLGHSQPATIMLWAVFLGRLRNVEADCPVTVTDTRVESLE